MENDRRGHGAMMETSMDAWHGLMNILILLAGALVFGSAAEMLRQSAIIGYLIAGLLVGPKVLGWAGTGGDAGFVTELGAALLLFTIGLEFSFKRLVRLGGPTVMAGVAQIVLTSVVGAGAAALLGLGAKTAVAAGAVISLSSTASVLRLLADNTMLDSQHGRAATGILLLQDIAVVPLVLLVTTLAGKSGPGGALPLLFRAVGMSAAVFFAFYILLNIVAPRALNMRIWAKNRELPILLAIVIAAGSAFAAHAAGISPAFGAFLAGMLLAESPFAVQIRADVGAVRAMLAALFFAAVGMYADPAWAAANWLQVTGATVAILALKTAVVAGSMPALKFRLGVSLASGLCISQVGEFSFVLAGIAAGAGLFGEHLFKLIVTSTILSLLVTPYLVRFAPYIAGLMEPPSNRRGRKQGEGAQYPAGSAQPVVVIGFGPAGQQAADALSSDFRERLVVVDSNQANSVAAALAGVEFHVGDARHPDVLEHINIRCAAAVIITLPDPQTSRRIIALCHDLAPQVKIIARARYNVCHAELEQAGAAAVVNEESHVGLMLAEAFRAI